MSADIVVGCTPRARLTGSCSDSGEGRQLAVRVRALCGINLPNTPGRQLSRQSAVLIFGILILYGMTRIYVGNLCSLQSYRRTGSSQSTYLWRAHATALGKIERCSSILISLATPWRAFRSSL